MTISVALCTYNGELFLEEQLDSILNQTLKVDEIIICDDGSTDKTISIIDNYAMKNPSLITLFQNEINLKSVKNFEKAISLCTGDYIFLSDQDDIWVNTKVATYIDLFLNKKDINVIASNGFCINNKSQVIEKHAIWDIPQFFEEKKIPFDYFKIITHAGNFATGASMAIRASFINEILPIPLVKDFHHDEWIAIIAASKDAFLLIPNKLFYYRIHENQQVGGVFFDKTDITKIKLLETYSINYNLHKFKNCKSQLKKLTFSHEKALKLAKVDTKHKPLFEQNLLAIVDNFINIKKIMSKKFPVRSFLLNRIDSISGKRQLKV
ncbi:glycosyl transferase [Flavobacterium branchiophilum]|uniref:Glycosyl transferase family 2 n=1 Tax=Flavobacterium branchiophilum TaxID=55197 RepID=A0A543G7H3_9FLAO|nr:glycosyltransferase family 2 protein [Flavobacterium branchiophilum]OXA69931.1 glycosyl transferase [Flavobacterium branchiophilum] [Flavobacterium branchiophilum NBRC 15030 = ATCC 35035]TQM42036.1 glycosyl transferase family 2 [Flavobacterium branchiophilum]GEM53807.1 glycosyl transferase [Flavobacterium branchiophilum NBRC 15030 = ATCC 35035]